MSRQAGRKGRVYIGIASDTATAEPLPFVATWSVNFTVKQDDVTAMEDDNMVYVADMPDAQGQFAGFYDTATPQTYAAAKDGLPRKFYLYPNVRDLPSQYFWGTVLPDFSTDGGVGAGQKITVKWAAASSIQKVG